MVIKKNDGDSYGCLDNFYNFEMVIVKYEQVKLSLVTLNGIEYPCHLEKEEELNPEPEMLIKARLSIAKKKLFHYI